MPLSCARRPPIARDRPPTNTIAPRTVARPPRPALTPWNRRRVRCEPPCETAPHTEHANADFPRSTRLYPALPDAPRRAYNHPRTAYTPPLKIETDPRPRDTACTCRTRRNPGTRTRSAAARRGGAGNTQEGPCRRPWMRTVAGMESRCLPGADVDARAPARSHGENSLYLLNPVCRSLHSCFPGTARVVPTRVDRRAPRIPTSNFAQNRPFSLVFGAKSRVRPWQRWA